MRGNGMGITTWPRWWVFAFFLALAAVILLSGCGPKTPEEQFLQQCRAEYHITFPAPNYLVTEARSLAEGRSFEATLHYFNSQPGVDVQQHDTNGYDDAVVWNVYQDGQLERAVIRAPGCTALLTIQNLYPY